MESKDSLQITVGGYSDQGEKSQNQDAFALKLNSGIDLELKGHVAVIADGVSSANCAEQASQMSVCHFIDEYLATPDSWSVNKSASQVISSLNKWLYARQLVNGEQGELEQWFSTFSALILKGNRGHLFHVGDCQIAKVNDDGYQVLTSEHSTPAGILNRAVGAGRHVEIDVALTELAVDDFFILACDGVHQFVKPKQIQQILIDYDDLELASKMICDLAGEQGSLDNLTCLLLRINQLPAQALEQIVFTRKQQVIPPPLRIGAKLDHFEIIDVLEQSTRSHVYLARDPIEQRLVVIKTPSINFTDDDDYLEGFIKEGWVGTKFNHPAIMKIYPEVQNSQFLYHACEHIEGQTLAHWCSENLQPSLRQVRTITEQIVKALRVLQRFDVVHGDIKADNFMIDLNGRIKLIDFGSCDVGSFEQHHELVLVKGTLNFTAPELFNGGKSNHQSDLFSLGTRLPNINGSITLQRNESTRASA